MNEKQFQLVPFSADTGGMKSENQPLSVTVSGAIQTGFDHLWVRYTLGGSMNEVTFPARSSDPARLDLLWQHTCFELFARQATHSEYWEFNLSPSRDWNVYHFPEYRRDPQPETAIPAVTVRDVFRHGDAAGLLAQLPLPAQLLGRELEIGIASVIEDVRGKLHYFALTHHKPVPDFHDPGSFTLRLPPVPPVIT